MKKVYVDTTECDRNVMGIFVGGAEVIMTGTTVNTMSIKANNNEYKSFAEVYDIHFIFDDKIPKADFYTVPLIDIMAMDGIGGYIGTIGAMTDLQGDAAICYISKERKCYTIASNGREFLNGISDWRKHMKPYENIAFYNSKDEAAKEIDFYQIKESKAEIDR